jgi:uncharacterized protein (TIGR03435 family)
MKKTLLPLLFLLSLSALAASQDGPKVGDKPPLLQATALLQAPPGTKLDARSLRGKVVVLEFWATWCGPCVAAIPHMNELAEKFKDKPVQFVAITEEDEATIKSFLSKRPIKAWVALDADKAMNRAYGVVAIPHTVVLDKNGKIAGITYPTLLTERHIDDLLAGKKISLREPSSGEGITAGKDPDEKNQAPPLFEVMVRPSAGTNSEAAWGGGKLTARGYTVWNILQLAFDQSSSRILTNAPLPEGNYDFIVAQPKGTDEKTMAILRQALESAFGLTGRKETNEVEVLLLKVTEPNAKGLVVSATPGGSFRTGLGTIEAINTSVGGIARALEGQLQKPVIDETGLTNHYDVALKWEQESFDKPNPDGLAKALREQLGLNLIPARRPVEMVLVEQVKQEPKGDNK